MSILTIIIIILVICKLLDIATKKAQKHNVEKGGVARERVSKSTTYYHDLVDVDSMDGQSFEYWCADLLKYNGFSKIQLTPGSGDQGVDIIAWKDGLKYAIQCKRYSKNLGNKPIQEVNTGRIIYGCSRAAVMTNQYFTTGAVSAANAVGVQLWGRDVLSQMLKQKNTALNKQSKEYRRQEHNKKKQLKRQTNDSTAATSEVVSDRQDTIQQRSKPITNREKTQADHAKSRENSLYSSTHQKRVSQYNQAVNAAKDYLSSGSFSKKGLINQLEHDGFSHDQAIFAADNCGANWFINAKEEVKTYLSNSGYSRSGLIEQLMYDGYTKEEAESAVDGSEILWKYQAYKQAQAYLASETLSKDGLIEQLEYEGFTHEEATYAADRI